MIEPGGMIPATGATGGAEHAARAGPAARAARSSTALGRLRIRLRHLFYGHRPAAVAFQAGVLAVDFAAIGYFLATTFVADAPWLRAVDLSLGVLLALEFLG